MSARCGDDLRQAVSVDEERDVTAVAGNRRTPPEDGDLVRGIREDGNAGAGGPALVDAGELPRSLAMRIIHRRSAEPAFSPRRSRERIALMWPLELPGVA